MWGFLVASRCIFIQVMTLLDHRNTATTKKLDFKNSHLTSVGATTRGALGAQLMYTEMHFFSASRGTLRDKAFYSSDGGQMLIFKVEFFRCCGVSLVQKGHN